MSSSPSSTPPRDEEGLYETKEEEPDETGHNDSRIWDFDFHGKLYCRSKETAELEQVYRRVTTTTQSATVLSKKTEFVLISGDAGVGKTALAQSIRSRAVADDGYFVMGKFDQLQRPEPHAAIVAAFTEFAACVMVKGQGCVDQIREAVKESVASEGKVLTDMIPELEQILGHQESLNNVAQSSEAVNRFKYVFRMFLRAVSSPEHPLVVCLDDVHWADEASLDLLESIVTDCENDGIIFLGTYREGGPCSRRFLNMVSGLDKNKVTVTNIKLETFEEDSVSDMLADVLIIDHNETQSLASVICSQTKGNIYFILEFLRSLKESGLLHFDSEQGRWKWDVQEIHVDSNNLSDLIRAKIALLPRKTQETLKIASCLGSRIEEDILTVVMNEPVFSYLQLAVSKGLIKPDRVRGGYTFTHDGVQEAMYSLIPEGEREAFHLKIGRKLWRRHDSHDSHQADVFAVVGQLMVGTSLITDQKEKDKVADLCRRAGERAVHLSSFHTAYLYLLHGISLLDKQCWRDSYKLTLGLYNAAAEVAYCVAKFDSVTMFVEEIFKHSRNFDDTLRGHATKVYALGSSGQVNEATATALEVLEKLNESFPKKSTMADVETALKKLSKRLKGKSDKALLSLPDMTDPEKLAAMQMLNLTFLYAYLQMHELAPLIGFRMVSLTLDHGLCTVSCVGFVVMAMLLCGVGNDIDEGYRYGKLGVRMYEKFDSKSWLGRVSAAYFGCVHGWKKPIQETLDPLKYAHRVGLETGDIEFAMLNANLYCWSQLDITPLPELEKEIGSFNERMQFYGQKLNMLLVKPAWQMMRNFMGQASGDPMVLTGDIMVESQLEEWKHVNDSVYVWSHFHRMMLAYMFGDYDRAEKMSSGCRSLTDYPWGAVDVAVVVFFDGLTALAQAKKNKQKKAPLAEKRLQRLQYWAKHSPLNFLGKQFLLEAEMAVITGQHDSAISKFTCAIALSREGGFIMQTALANERAGRYLLERGDKESAIFHIREAISLYKRWGASAKVKHLKAEMKGTF